MSVEELNTLHRRYVDLSARFRAAWAFHQLIQSVQKIILEESGESFAPDFRDIYARLKGLSQNLKASETPHIRTELDTIGRDLSRLDEQLLEEDTRILPRFLRQFLQRVKNYDDKILMELVKFYLYTRGDGEGWNEDRLDKIDFLLTQLAQVGEGSTQLRERRHLREMLQGLWAILDGDTPTPEVVEEHRRAIGELRDELAGVESLDQLNTLRLVARYRELKHSLGDLFFEPGVALAILETNLKLKDTVQQLYQQEERRIVTDYHRVFELEREVPTGGELGEELNLFRQDVERFEKQLETDELKLEDLATIRERVRSLLPRLSRASRREEQEVVTGEFEAADLAPDLNPPRPAALAPETADGAVREMYDRLVEALEQVSQTASARAVALSPELYALRLEPREVVAFRRLRAEEPCDRELERFLLEAAAVRARLNEQAEELQGVLDETSTTGESPAHYEARGTLRHGSAYLARFEHFRQQIVLGGKPRDAQQLEILRMRLMRDYAGLWLLAYKPYLMRQR